MLSMVAHPERARTFAIHHRVLAKQGGIKFLGSPLGSQAFAAALLDERVTKIQLLINELMKLDNKQVAFILLRH
jgi:hypothetical protein